MSNETTNQSSSQPISELELARQVRELDSGHMPQRDLWVGIERQIVQHPQKPRDSGNQVWMPYAVAASLLIAVSALLLNISMIQGTFQDQPGNFDQATTLTDMKQEYMQVRNPMYEEFTRANQFLDAHTRDDLQNNLEILEAARRDLEQQVKQNPNDHGLMQMLIRVHQQELELLRQDYSTSTRSM